MPGDGALTTEEYAAAMEKVFTIGDDEIEAAFGDFFFNGVFSEAEAQRLRSLEASDSWSDDDAEFASQTAETLLQAVTGLYDLVVNVFNTILDESSRLRPPEHLSDLHGNFIATTGEVVQLVQTQLEAVKNADTEVTSSEELADFRAVVNSLESGPLDPETQQRAEELTAQGDAACLALKSQLETELGRDVSICNPEESDVSFDAPDATSAAPDRAALIALYNATDGPNWTNNDNWLSDEPLGEWYGVETDTVRVIGLVLSENGLNGEIPAELGQLSDLDWLDLYANQLSGNIPPELGRLSRLLVLDLGDNDLSGEIPAELGQLSALEHLPLFSNNLTGAIPAELGQLSYLDYLDLGDNDLSGEIPAELGQLSLLTGLYLAGNELSGCVPDALSDVEGNDFEELGLPFC